jgi:hypothetical protein
MLRTVVVVTLAFSLVACSFATTRPPKSGEPDDTCNTSEVSPVLDASWAVLEGLVTMLVIQDAVSGGTDASGPVLAGVGATALFTGAAIYGFRNVRQCRNRNKDIAARAAEAEALRAKLPAARDAAWQMTKQAHTAAIGGDCATASALGEVVRTTDEDFFASVFMRDVAIARCAAAPPPGAPPGAQPPAPPAPPPTDQELPVSPP